MTIALSRRDLLRSAPLYDKHRDGPDALPMGTPHTQVPYTGGTRIALDDTLASDRVVYMLRNNADTFQPWLVETTEDERAARVPDGMWDWDCTYCHTAVITEVGEHQCPNCLLS